MILLTSARLVCMQSLGFVKHACSCYGFVRFRDDEAHKNLHHYLDIGDH
jgi:hypothetical protein